MEMAEGLLGGVLRPSTHWSLLLGPASRSQSSSVARITPLLIIVMATPEGARDLPVRLTNPRNCYFNFRRVRFDDVHSLKHGGADAPNNMQWQTTAAAKAKDKTE
jgi:hypothetical protein